MPTVCFQQLTPISVLHVYRTEIPGIGCSASRVKLAASGSVFSPRRPPLFTLNSSERKTSHRSTKRGQTDIRKNTCSISLWFRRRERCGDYRADSDALETKHIYKRSGPEPGEPVHNSCLAHLCLTIHICGCYKGATLLIGGAVAQLGARLDGIEEVVGSNPIGSTILFNHLRLFDGLRRGTCAVVCVVTAP
jgi:hypothetical protein